MCVPWKRYGCLNAMSSVFSLILLCCLNSSRFSSDIFAVFLSFMYFAQVCSIRCVV